MNAKKCCVSCRKTNILTVFHRFDHLLVGYYSGALIILLKNKFNNSYKTRHSTNPGLLHYYFSN